MHQDYVIVSMTVADEDAVHHVLRSKQYRKWLRDTSNDALPDVVALHDLLKAVGKVFSSPALAEEYVDGMHGVVSKRVEIRTTAPLTTADFGSD
jgi:hypothetical protein